MARAPTTLDSFNAVAEPRRRRVLDFLADGPRQVNDIVARLGWPQPQVSKHLGVLRQVGLVNVQRDGRRQVYSINAGQIRPMYDWTRKFEKLWSQQLERIKTVAEAKTKRLAETPTKPLNKRGGPGLPKEP